jgi:hypothetical protein
MDVGRRGTFVALGDPLRPQRGNGTFVGAVRCGAVRVGGRTQRTARSLRYS